MRGEYGEADIGTDAAVRVEGGRPEAVEAEAAAAPPPDSLRDTALLAELLSNLVYGGLFMRRRWRWRRRWRRWDDGGWRSTSPRNGTCWLT